MVRSYSWEVSSKLLLRRVPGNLLSRLCSVAITLDVLLGAAVVFAQLRTATVVLVERLDSRFISIPRRIELVKRFENGIFASKDPAIDEVWERLGELVPHVRARRDGEDVIQLLKGALLGLRNP